LMLRRGKPITQSSLDPFDRVARPGAYPPETLSAPRYSAYLQADREISRRLADHYWF